MVRFIIRVLGFFTPKTVDGAVRALTRAKARAEKTLEKQRLHVDVSERLAAEVAAQVKNSKAEAERTKNIIGNLSNILAE